MAISKECTLCHKDKTLEAFSVLLNGKNGRNSQCKDCRNKIRPIGYSRQEEGDVLCQKCREYKDVLEFSSDRARKNGLQSYCKTCQQKINSERKKIDSLEGYIHILYRDLINNANSRKIAVTVTETDIVNLYNKQQGMCAVSGIKMTYAKEPGTKNTKKTINNVSVDRIDPTKTYTTSNIQLVINLINRIKWDMTQEEFLETCKSIVEHNEGINQR